MSNRNEVLAGWQRHPAQDMKEVNRPRRPFSGVYDTHQA